MLVNTVICVLGIGNRRCTENSMIEVLKVKKSVEVEKRSCNKVDRNINNVLNHNC